MHTCQMTPTECCSMTFVWWKSLWTQTTPLLANIASILEMGVPSILLRLLCNWLMTDLVELGWQGGGCIIFEMELPMQNSFTIWFLLTTVTAMRNIVFLGISIISIANILTKEGGTQQCFLSHFGFFSVDVASWNMLGWGTGQLIRLYECSRGCLEDIKFEIQHKKSKVDEMKGKLPWKKSTGDILSGTVWIIESSSSRKKIHACLVKE